MLSKWRQIFLILMFFYAGYRSYGVYQQKQLAKHLVQMRNTATAKNDFGVIANCSGKKYCITVFVAPWCPACKGSQGSFKLLNEYLPKNRADIGFGVVIGDGTVEQSLAEQQVISPIEVIIDTDKTIFKNRDIGSYPTWSVTNKSGNEIFKRSSGIGLTSAAQVPQFLEQFLHITP